MIKWLPMLLLASAAPGWADTIAVYEAPQLAMRMTIEIADNGDFRGETATGSYMLSRGGAAYIITPSADGPIVERADDVAAVMADLSSATMTPEIRESLASRPPVEFVAKGEKTIQGRKGVAWYLKSPEGKLSEKPIVVISHDPALAPLGAAMARQFDMSVGGVSGMMGGAPSFAVAMQKLLATGTPLLFAGAELQSVREAPVPPEHFALPAEPQSREAIRLRLAAQAPIRTAPETPTAPEPTPAPAAPDSQ